MLTIKHKFGIVLSLIFIISIIVFNSFMDKFFYQRFKIYVSEDMKENYTVSFKNLEDYILINDIERDSILDEDLIDSVMKFIVDRVYCQGVIFDFDGKVLSTGITSENEIDIELLTKLPSSFELAIDNKTVLDIEKKNAKVYGKLSYCIYGKDYKPIGILVLIKDYSGEYNRNIANKNLINISVAILFIIIFIAVYLLSSRMIKPIVILKDKVSEISKGRYPDKLPVKSKDEIGVLVQSFNTMSEKLRLKDEQEKAIFRNITHELKTPLASISGYAQILRDNEVKEEFKNKALNRIVSESNRMHELVVTLLNISKQSSDLEEYSFEKVNIKEIIDDSISINLPEIKSKGLEIIEEYDDAIVNGNNQYLTILFRNLINNGIKYCYKNTKVVINLNSEGSEVIFSILTEGKEIPENMRGKVFDPFIKVEKGGFSSKTSHGLGLYICKNIVEAHNGCIQLEVNDNISEFIVKLPSFNTLETT